MAANTDAIAEQHRIVTEKMAEVDGAEVHGVPEEVRDAIKKKMWDEFVGWSSSQY